MRRVRGRPSVEQEMRQTGTQAAFEQDHAELLAIPAGSPVPAGCRPASRAAAARGSRSAWAVGSSTRTSPWVHALPVASRCRR
jgi:hypothetical protein